MTGTNQSEKKSKQKLQEHAWCRVIFKDGSLQQTLQNGVPDLLKISQNLRDGIISGAVTRYTGNMCYRAIRPLARFHPDYRAAGEVLLNSNTLEAVSRLSFATIKSNGNFHTHPGVIDALSQACGFIMNCNDFADPDLEGDVFMNHGWSSLQLFEPLDFNEEYTTYVQMKDSGDSLWHGDVVVLNSKDKVVAYIGHVAVRLAFHFYLQDPWMSMRTKRTDLTNPLFQIQQVARKILRVILSIESGTASKAQKQLPARYSDSPAPTPASTTTPETKIALKVPAATRAPAPSPIQAPKEIQVPAGQTRSDTFSKALTIVAEESGVAEADLTDNTNFADIGVDSLLGLTISARFKEELDTDVDFNALLFEHPTVGELKSFFGGGGSGGGDSSAESPSSSYSGLDTPRSSTGDGSVISGDESVMSSRTSTDGDILDSSKQKCHVEPVAGDFEFTRALQVISEESGVALDDLTDDTAFSDAGVDSLLSLVIVSRFRDELELDIQHESLLLEFPTVGELRTALVGDGAAQETNQPAAVAERNEQLEIKGMSPQKRRKYSSDELSALKAREEAVDKFVAKYTAGYSGPAHPPAVAPAPKDDEKVVIITGASGSLGSHLAWHIVQMPDVKSVICLNRQHREEPYKRQIKAMRDKGIRFPESLKPKLMVVQTDTSKPMLGLKSEDYERLASTATHLIHSAWPMSGKRALNGFEPQFQVVRNLIDLATEVASRRPQSFKFSFQLVSSIGVVGLYGKEDSDAMTKQVLVPEERFGIDCILPNGYGDAKWGCERMLDMTLHKSPHRFRAMVVRLGQIAGSKTSGYWNPMEHFGFVVKSSQTLGALPDVPGGELYWTPVNDMADALIDLVLSDHDPHRFYHLENPWGQPWREVNAVLADAVGIKDMIPFEEWVKRVAAAPQRNNPASTLLEFLDDNYIRMSYGGLVLDPKNTLEHSKSLRAVRPISEELVRKYVHIWKEIGFLS